MVKGQMTGVQMVTLLLPQDAHTRRVLKGATQPWVLGGVRVWWGDRKDEPLLSDLLPCLDDLLPLLTEKGISWLSDLGELSVLRAWRLFRDCLVELRRVSRLDPTFPLVCDAMKLMGIEFADCRPDQLNLDSPAKWGEHGLDLRFAHLLLQHGVTGLPLFLRMQAVDFLGMRYVSEARRNVLLAHQKRLRRQH